MSLQTRTAGKGRCFAFVGLLGLILFTFPTPAFANQAAVKSREGLMWARWKRCDKATPLLEEALLLRHRAQVALALADCYASSDKLMEAVEIYRALAEEKITRKHLYQDRVAIRRAPKRLAEAEARLPTIAFELPIPYEGLEVTINGRLVPDPETPRQVAPDLEIVITARATGYDEFQDEVTLAEREHLVRPLHLTESVPEPAGTKKKPGSGPDSDTEDALHEGIWLGLRGRGYVIPTFAWRFFGDGGRTVLAPGGALTLTTRSSDADLMFSLGYASYGVGPTPFKGKSAPDTDWEIIESDMHAAYFTVELAWRSPLDEKGTWEFFWGGGIGMGWTFAGNLKRTQAYPPSLMPGNPYTYEKCAGPNNPPGSYLYCNQLSHSANHYDYNEPNWFAGGKRPLLYPWLAFPQLGLTYKPSRSTALDLELGLTTGGLLVGLGARGR